MELQIYHSQSTSCEVCCQIWMVISVVSYFIKKRNVTAVFTVVLILRLLQVKLLNTKSWRLRQRMTKCLDVRLALYGCI